VQEPSRREEERRKERKREKRKRGKEMGGREKGEKKKERERGASAPIAAATAVGRPRARVIRALREEKRIAPALIAERRSRVVVDRRAVWDGTAARKKRVRSLEIGLGQQLEPSVWSAKSSGGD
jgi:hypothetical protein